MSAQSALAAHAAHNMPDFEAMRRAMVDCQLRTSDVTEPALVAALLAVPREDFLPADRQASAYIDRAVGLTRGRALNPPLTTARLIAAADIEAGQRILLIGGASGYAAAVLAQMGAIVTMVESDAELIAQARGALSGCETISIVSAELPAGAADGAPYDRVIIDGAVEAVPQAVAEQLRDGGVLTTGLAAGRLTRIARAVHVAGAALRPIPLAEIECVRLPGFAPPARFSF